MSQENVELVRRAYLMHARGAFEEVAAFLSDDVEWRPAVLPILGREAVRGREAVLHFWKVEMFDELSEFSAEALEVEDHGECVLVKTRYVGRGRQSDAVIEQTTYSKYVFRDGKVAAMADYVTRHEAVAAIGEHA